MTQSLPASFVLMLLACVGDKSSDTPADSAADSGGDSGTDTADTGADSAEDTATETGEDTGGDTATDTADDTGGDTATDTADDTAADTSDDTADDTAEDTAADTAEDTGGDPATDPAEPTVTFDITVCGDGSEDYTDIQDAIDAAAPGDSISVCPGTYGPINVPWSAEVYVTSTDGRDTTFIDGGVDPAVVVDNGALTLSGFGVTGTAFDDPYYPEGAAFSIHEGDLTVSDCRVTDTTGNFTVLFDENFLAMDDVEWEDNTTDYLWYLSEGANADITHNTVRGGTHEQVLDTSDLDNMLMSNNLFIDIQISSGFTAFSLTSNGVGTLDINNNIFYNIDDADPWGGRTVNLDGVEFRSNIISACDAWDLTPMEANYNVFWDNGVDYSTEVTGTGNLYVDPLFTDAASEDFTLMAGSPAVDAGDPAALFDDADASRNDIGRYGGPYEAAFVPYTRTDSETITGTTLRTLTVTNGYGDGAYLAGEVVHVWADVDPQTEILSGWSGGTLTDPDEWSSDFTMPDADTTLTATTATAALPLSSTSYTLAGTARSVLYAIPSSPRGIVLFFHSALGNNTELYDNGTASVARTLYDAGFGIVAMDSDIAAIAGSGGWSDSTDDETLDLAATRELMVELAYWGTPVIAWGVGNGAQFAHDVGLMLPADAVLSYCAPGRRFQATTTDAPTGWFLAERDSTYLTAAEDATLYAAALTVRGINAEVHVHAPTLLYDERFTRVDGVDATLSASIAAGLLADGYADADGNWLVTGEDAVDDLSGYGLTAEQEAGVAAEIRIMAADGQLYDEDAAATLAFLDTVIP